MFWIVSILVSALLTALAGWQVGGVPAAMFTGSLGALVVIAARDISKHRHAIFASSLILGITGYWFGGWGWALMGALMAFFLLLALHEHLTRKDVQLPIGLAIMLLCGALGFHYASGVAASRGAVGTVASLIGFLTWIGVYDFYLQRTHAIRRNFPIIGWCRYGFELIGDELRQYWFLNNREEKPYSRATRRYLYRSGKGINNNLGFGTEEDYSAIGQYHFYPSQSPIPDHEMGNTLPQLVIGPNRPVPYVCKWPIGISGMSYGAASEEAVMALSSGAKLAEIHMATGEGGLTPFHLNGVTKRVPFRATARYYLSLFAHYCFRFGRGTKPVKPQGEKVGGAKIIVQLGPAKFGFRRFFMDAITGPEGRGFRKRWTNQIDWEKLIKVMSDPQCVMLEIKNGQGAKPGDGGKLPKEKLTPEIAEWRGVELGKDCKSPNSWKQPDAPADEQFWDIPSLVAFVELVKSKITKPVGVKTYAGDPDWYDQLAEYMAKTGQGPDYLCIDGGEGGTGAAPVVLADSFGLPLFHAIPQVDNAFRKHGIRDNIVLIGSGQLARGDQIMKAIAMGLDMVHIARAFLIGGLRCIQAQKCHTNRCPVGALTQDPRLRRGLDPADKYVTVGNVGMVFERELIMECKTMGIRHPWELNRHMLSVVTKPSVSERLSDLHPYPDDGKRNPTLAPAPPCEADDCDERGPKLIQIGVISRPTAAH